MKLFTLIALALLPLTASSQGLEDLIMSNQFVVCAVELRGENHVSELVKPSYNFVMIDGNRISVQWQDRAGNNGLGGFTQNGTIKKQETVKKTYMNGWKFVSKIQSKARFDEYNLELSLSSDGNALITVTRSLDGNDQIQLFGKIYPIDIASIVMGIEEDLQSLKMLNIEPKYSDWQEPEWDAGDKNFNLQL